MKSTLLKVTRVFSSNNINVTDILVNYIENQFEEKATEFLSQKIKVDTVAHTNNERWVA
jgi:hypothetical protein